LARSTPAVLDGTTLLDLSEQVPGPNATRLLAALGATVIKVERPTGDPLRDRPAMFASQNRGKRDLCIDLKAPAGRATLLRLVQQVDVLVEGFRPGVMDRLGLGFTELSAVNPRLIQLSISGYGAEGPYRDLPGHDFQYLSLAGGIPAPPPEFAAAYVPTTVPVADLGAAVWAALTVVTALHEKLRLGAAFTARRFDLAMTDCVLAMMEPRIAEAMTMPTTAAALARPGYGVYLTADGGYVTIGALEDHFWERLVDCLELSELSELYPTFQQRRDHVGKIEPLLRRRVAELTREQVIDLLVKNDVPIAPVNDLHDPVRDEHFRRRGMVYEVPGEEHRRVSEWPVAMDAFAARDVTAVAPGIGQHSRPTLAGFGFTDSEIDELISGGIVRQSGETPSAPPTESRS
jgi:crotonobetainyl-CoA:carnitine CoA-transferase CaiB-like acyl-CoA transferase